MLAKNTEIKRDFYTSAIDKNLALLGQRKYGKTLLAKQWLPKQKDSVHVFLDLEKTSLSPENFSLEFIGSILFSYFKDDIHNLKNYKDRAYLLEKSAKADSKSCENLLKGIDNELQKIKPNQEFILKSAFDFLTMLSRDTGKKFAIVFDNFENFTSLENFPGIKDVFSLINFRNKNINYLITSSAVNYIKSLELKDFEIKEIQQFSEQESQQLINNLSKGLSKETSKDILKYAQGQPLLINILSEYKEDIKNNFLKGLLTKNKAVYNYCKEKLNFSLYNARGNTLLKAILKVVAENKSLTLTEISRKIYRSAPVTKSLLERLIAVDLIVKENSTYRLSDLLLANWLRLTGEGFDFDFEPSLEDLKEVKYEE